MIFPESHLLLSAFGQYERSDIRAAESPGLGMRGNQMHTNATIEELRRATNPLFNDRKLKLGTFCTNLNGGCAISTIPYA